MRTNKLSLQHFGTLFVAGFIVTCHLTTGLAAVPVTTRKIRLVVHRTAYGRPGINKIEPTVNDERRLK